MSCVIINVCVYASVWTCTCINNYHIIIIIGNNIVASCVCVSVCYCKRKIYICRCSRLCQTALSSGLGARSIRTLRLGLLWGLQPPTTPPTPPPPPPPVPAHCTTSVLAAGFSPGALGCWGTERERIVEWVKGSILAGADMCRGYRGFGSKSWGCRWRWLASFLGGLLMIRRVFSLFWFRFFFISSKIVGLSKRLSNLIRVEIFLICYFCTYEFKLNC